MTLDLLQLLKAFIKSPLVEKWLKEQLPRLMEIVIKAAAWLSPEIIKGWKKHQNYIRENSIRSEFPQFWKFLMRMEQIVCCFAAALLFTEAVWFLSLISPAPSIESFIAVLILAAIEYHGFECFAARGIEIRRKLS